MNFAFDKVVSRKFADAFNLYPVPDTHKSCYFGDNNVYIDYEFDDIKISEEDLKYSAEKIYDDKNGGNSDILIIWGDQNQFLKTENLIIKELKEKFRETTFHKVYFLAFHNTVTINNIRILCLRII